MSIVETLGEQFTEEMRSAGRADFERSGVTIDRASRGRIKATVTELDSTNYQHVQFIFDDGNLLDRRCACAQFAEAGQCSHLYAAVLQANADGLLDAEAFELVPAGDGRTLRYTSTSNATATEPAKPKPPAWKRQFEELRNQLDRPQLQPIAPWPQGTRLAYLIDIGEPIATEGIVLTLGRQKLGKANDWRPAQPTRFRDTELAANPDDDDRPIVQMLTGALTETTYHYTRYNEPITHSNFRLTAQAAELLLPRMCATERCFMIDSDLNVDPEPLIWDDQPAWQLWLEVVAESEGERYRLEMSLRRGEERLPLNQAKLLSKDGLVIANGRVSQLQHFGAFSLAGFFIGESSINLAAQQADEMLGELLKMAPLPRLELASELGVKTRQSRMVPHLTIGTTKALGADQRLVAKLSFDYGGSMVEEEGAVPGFDLAKRELIVRDPAAESAAVSLLNELGVKSASPYQPVPRLLAPSRLGNVVAAVCREGWFVQAEGKVHRQPGEFSLEVSSGIDWFELKADIDFGGAHATLPALLTALRKGERVVQLDDGSVGVLPEEWLSRYGLLARMANQEEGQVRFSMRQVGLLDALLASVPNTVDETFENARRELLDFAGVKAADVPEGFHGTLREYQREGLGWLNFLNKFGFGGCLADDMGLGKTIQVLSLLCSRRENGRPSLVVVPRSLVFNWVEEAKRFAPQLRVLDHTGANRPRTLESFENFDMVLATYGTMRLDAPLLKDFRFDYAVLDEAQSIKNSASESAKACRLLQADHRLALTGTPIQNHLGELWSLFEFLNPGMLGAASIFRATGASSAAPPDKDSRQLLSRALRPFILRRTKEQVAKDLPEKTEQTLWCDLDTQQRKLYDELRDHYRSALLQQTDLNKSKIQILEALLRLRQAACHPGLIDKQRVGESSAKLEALLPLLSELMEEGHKVLVFSQFTSLLAIVRQHLDAQKITYEYLDGKTKDRQARVDRFQTDADCKLFLISLKAGGLGLNLTQAEYVFLLDPWWNPAIEAQAIDRAHRIGQTRRVFAYRIIARDTVEQKVLELQSRKKDLADMILTADNSLISKLDREDLQMLLS